jgi:hypothetical protein
MRTIRDEEPRLPLNDSRVLSVDKFFTRNRLQVKYAECFKEVPKTSDFDDAELYYGFEGICTKS